MAETLKKTSKSITKHIRISRKTLAKKFIINIQKFIDIRANHVEKEKRKIIAEICDYSGIKPKKLAMYANNNFTVIDARELYLISKVLKVKIDELITEEEATAN